VGIVQASALLLSRVLPTFLHDPTHFFIPIMDVTGIIAAETAKQYGYPITSCGISSKWLLVLRSALEVEKDIPVEIDAGLLSVTDMNHIDAEAYASVNFFAYYLTSWPSCSPPLSDAP
jgi:hypothetical protein